jgi:nucleotide-binding universal stress UspA family protein
MAERMKIYVGVDGSEGAARALRWALEEARARDGELTAVMSWSYIDQHPMRGHNVFEPEYTSNTAHHALRQYVEDALGATDAKGVALEAVCDTPAHGLLSATSDADLIVVGSRGLGGFKELVLGSVAHQITMHAACPVVVVPPERVAPE